MPKLNFSPTQLDTIVDLYADLLLKKAKEADISPEKILLAFDNDGTLFPHSWGEPEAFGNDKGNHAKSNIPFFLLVKERVSQLGFKVKIVSNQYKNAVDPKKANLIGIYQRYIDAGLMGAEDLIGREFTKLLGKGGASKTRDVEGVVVIDDQGAKVIEEGGGYREAGFKDIDKIIDGNGEMKAWPGVLGAERRECENHFKNGGAFGFCPESVLFHLIQNGVDIPAEILAAAGCESFVDLGKKCAESLGLNTGVKEVATESRMTSGEARRLLAKANVAAELARRKNAKSPAPPPRPPKPSVLSSANGGVFNERDDSLQPLPIAASNQQRAKYFGNTESATEKSNRDAAIASLSDKESRKVKLIQHNIDGIVDFGEVSDKRTNALAEQSIKYLLDTTEVHLGCFKKGQIAGLFKFASNNNLPSTSNFADLLKEERFGRAGINLDTRKNVLVMTKEPSLEISNNYVNEPSRTSGVLSRGGSFDTPPPRPPKPARFAEDKDGSKEIFSVLKSKLKKTLTNLSALDSNVRADILGQDFVFTGVDGKKITISENGVSIEKERGEEEVYSGQKSSDNDVLRGEIRVFDGLLKNAEKVFGNELGSGDSGYVSNEGFLSPPSVDRETRPKTSAIPVGASLLDAGEVYRGPVSYI